MNLYQKLIEVRKTVPYLQKAKEGAQYNYVSSSQVLANCVQKMNELGVLLIPSVISHQVRESVIETHDKDGRVYKRTTTYFTEIDLIMRWANAEKPDEVIECPWYGQGVDIAGEKGVGKALTYAEKYFMLKFFNIATDKDDPDTFQQKYDEDDSSKSSSHPKAADKKSAETKKTTTATKNEQTKVDTGQSQSKARSNPAEVTERTPEPPPSDSKQTLSQAQVKRFYAIVGSSGATNDMARLILEDVLHGKQCLSIVDGKVMWDKVAKADYDKLCTLFESGKWEEYFTKMIGTESVQDLRDVG